MPHDRPSPYPALTTSAGPAESMIAGISVTQAAQQAEPRRALAETFAVSGARAPETANVLKGLRLNGTRCLPIARGQVPAANAVADEVLELVLPDVRSPVAGTWGILRSG